MAEYRLVVLEDTEMFKSGGDELAEYVKSIPESTIVLFVESNVDKRSKLYKAVKANGYICEMTSQTEGDLSVWAAGCLQSRKAHNKSKYDVFASKSRYGYGNLIY